jgi:hypothetical protein
MAGSTDVILSLEKYPVCPIDVDEYDTVSLDTPNGDVYCWYPDGCAAVWLKDGTYKFFWNKPTMADAILNQFGHHTSYTRFFKDGSVENKLNNQCYWWGPKVDGEAVVGSIFELCSECGVKNCYEGCIDDPCYRCGYARCYGDCYDRYDYDW